MSSHRIPDEELIAFAADELTGQDRERVARLVEANPEAARTVAMYRLAHEAIAADDSVEPPASAIERAHAIFRTASASEPVAAKPSWLERLDAIVANLVFDSRLQPAAVRFESDDSRIQLAYEAGETMIDLRAERVREMNEAHADRHHWNVMGQVDPVDEASSIDIAILPAGESAPEQTIAADETGMISFRLEPGVYDLRIRIGDEVISIPGLEIG